MWKGGKGQARGDKKSPPLENKKYTVLGASIELIYLHKRPTYTSHRIELSGDHLN